MQLLLVSLILWATVAEDAVGHRRPGHNRRTGHHHHSGSSVPPATTGCLYVQPMHESQCGMAAIDSNINSCGVANPTGMYVAVNPAWFMSANPNLDPICQKCVMVTACGKTVGPVKILDKRGGPNAASKSNFSVSSAVFAALGADTKSMISGATTTDPGPC